MPNLSSLINDQIRRLARREIKANTRSTRKASAQYRREIASLKRQAADLTRRLARVEKQQPKEISAPPELVAKARFRAAGVKSHRARLGLSAKDYGRLVGVAGLTIYQWEGGKSRPRKPQFARLMAVRGLGKREALRRLGDADPRAASPAAAKGARRKTRVRGRFKRTGEESILALVGRRALPTSAINAAWKKEGRAGKADATLGGLVKARKLKRTKIKGERGSRYSRR